MSAPLTNGAHLTNWAGNVTFGARRLHRPTTVEELQRVVASGNQVRALGTGHSFNRIADTHGDLVSVVALPQSADVDAARGCVRVSGGMRYAELGSRLQSQGLALHNLGSLPHISVAGACATGTHGSGTTNKSLSAAVSGVELVTVSGDRVTFQRGDERFGGAVLALGALGVVTHLTLDVEPSYDMRQFVYEDLSFGEFAADPVGVLAAGYSVSLFTDWRTPSFKQVWVKQRVGQELLGRVWCGAVLADGPRHPLPDMPPENCTEQGGAPGAWNSRLPHFRLEFTPSSGEELQSEWFVPRKHAVSALRALAKIRDVVAPVLQVSEIRTVAGDDLWISPAYGQDSVAFHFTWVADTAAVTPVLGVVEERLGPYGARPHWGKLFTTPPEVVADLYPRLDDTRALMSEYDPGGVLRNEFLHRYLIAGT